LDLCIKYCNNLPCDGIALATQTATSCGIIKLGKFDDAVGEVKLKKNATENVENVANV